VSSFKCRLTVPVALVMLAGAATPPATSAGERGPVSGSWVGTTSQHRPISFSVARHRATACGPSCPASQLDIVKFAYTVREQCSDGGADTSRDVISYLDVGANGSYSFTDPRPFDTLRVQSRLSGSTGSGTLEVTRRFNTKGVIDPKGKVVCRSGAVRWNAHIKVR
jgi:hypothetical protein